MIIRTSWHGIVLSCFSSYRRRRRCPRLCWRPIFPGPSSRWPWWITWPDCHIHQHLCTAFECVPRQTLWLSVVTRLVAVWNALHNFGLDATLRCQQQVLIRLVHTAYSDRFVDPRTVQLAGSQLASICNLRHDHFKR